MDRWFPLIPRGGINPPLSTRCCQVLGHGNENGSLTHCIYVIRNVGSLVSTLLADWLTTPATNGLAHQIYQDSFSLQLCWTPLSDTALEPCSEIKSKWKSLDRTGQRLQFTV